MTGRPRDGVMDTVPVMANHLLASRAVLSPR
jgi:hypothetical protein